MRALLVVLVGCLGCDVDGTMLLSEDGGAQAPDAMHMAPDAQAPSSDTGMQADRSPNQSTDTRMADTAPVSQNVPECSTTAGFTATACGYLLPGKCGGYSWAPKFKNGHQCGVCNQGRTSCLVNDRGPDECGKPLAPLLCVSGCAECCFQTVGSPCESDADCCSPLRCQAAGAGKVCK